MFTIQRADEADVDAMHGIQQRAFDEEGRRCGTREIPPLQETPASILHHVRTQLALVAKAGDETVGCVRGVVDGPTCTVRALVVEPSRHGQGIGSALLAALEADVGARGGIECIELTTNTLMEGNVPFYERHGWRVHARSEPLPGIRLAHLTKDVGRRAPTIVEASARDADAIRDLMAEVIAHDVTQDPALQADTVANVDANVDVWLRDPSRCVHLVARAGDRIVGVVLVKDFWNLCSLFVAPQAQRQGLGRRLVEAAAARCKGRSDVDALHLNAATNAIPFYRRLGGTERAAARPLPPGFLAMRLPL